MTIEGIQKIIVATLITGGVGGGFYALTGGKSATLEGMHLLEGRELIEDWDTIEANYKKDDNTDLIEGISNKALKL